MTITRGKPKSDLSEDLARQLNQLYGPCVQCQDCHGVCPALIDALLLPNIILRKETDKT